MRSDDFFADALRLGDRVFCLPVIHGSGDFAWEIRRLMTIGEFDCLAVPLPASFRASVLQAILDLPVPSIVVQRAMFDPGLAFSADLDEAQEDEPWSECSFVPIDPCQPVVAAIRTAVGEHMPCEFIDLETNIFEPYAQPLPDPYALKKVPLPQFSAAVLPNIGQPGHAQGRQRVRHMAWRLKELAVDYKRVLFVCSLLDWPWVRQAFSQAEKPAFQPDAVQVVEHYAVTQQSLYFLFGELPFVTGLYERAREDLDDDSNLAIDGVKELLIESREAYRQEMGRRAKTVSPQTLSLCLKYTRNLTLIDHLLTPQLVNLVTAAKQIVGDGFATHVLETAKKYPFPNLETFEQAQLGMDKAILPDGDQVHLTNRLPGQPKVWSLIKLSRKPDEQQRQKWKQRWNPFSQCSWPPEDEVIENFRSTVFDRALQALGQDLAKTEKFTTSIMDGIDVRDTLRHWYDQQIYVKVMPPNRGRLDTAVMLFDTPADPREYPWRTTWFAEHANESTLAFFATDYREEPVGPGICAATYGGAMFIYPPVPITDIWQDRKFDFATTLEERLLAAACYYSQCPHVALVSPQAPGPIWRKVARKYRKQWVHLPLARFSESTVSQLRIVHVLNSKQVRSYAAEFIRKA